MAARRDRGLQLRIAEKLIRSDLDAAQADLDALAGRAWTDDAAG